MRRLHLALLAIGFGLLGVLAVAGCGGGGGSSSQETSRWQEAERIEGACCYYSSLVIGANGVQVFTNTAADGTLGGLNLYENGTGRTVLRIDAPADAYIRTSAIIERGGRYYGLLETGDNYPGTNGYTPSWATSPNGVDWTWHGTVSPYGRMFGSGASLTMDENGHFRAWVDQGNDLYEMRSVDGLHWVDAGIVKEAPGVLFSSAARTPTGTMLAVADTWPSTSIAVLWQCHGQAWQVLEHKSAIHSGEKGVALTYADGLIHAYSRGLHWTTPSPECV